MYVRAYLSTACVRGLKVPILTLIMAGLFLLGSSLDLKSTQSISPVTKVPTFTQSILYIRAALKTE